MSGLGDCIKNWSACSEQVTNKLFQVDDESLKVAAKKREAAAKAQTNAKLTAAINPPAAPDNRPLVEQWFGNGAMAQMADKRTQVGYH